MVLHLRPAGHLSLFTQCANCHTVFQLSADVLRAAGGQVRCGRCGEIFSALARLAEDAGSFDAGESSYELEERADSILESVVAEHVAQALPDSPDEGEFDGSEIAQLRVVDFSEEHVVDEVPDEAVDSGSDEYADAAMEFTLPPGELDRIFVESVPPPFTLNLGTTPMAAEMPVPAEEDEAPLPDIEVIADNRPAEAARGPPSHIGEMGMYDLPSPPAGRAGWFALWIGAAVLSALLLAGQVVHRNRDALTAHGPWAPALRQVYASIGSPLSGAPNLAVFQLRQWGVSGDAAPGKPAADGTLRVRASILNSGPLPQPFPLLRLTLANRYGSALGSRDFEAAEYLGKPVARPMSSGETVDATLNIHDPGKDAEGFEIDVCLHGADKKIFCATDAAAGQAKP